MGLISLTLQAQKLTVESMTLADNDISARQYERKDLNGQACALVKVSLPSLGMKFEGNVIEPVEYKTGEYWVYMSAGSQELRIKHPQTQPLHVKFSDYGIKKVASKATYNLSIQMPEIEVGVAMAKAGTQQLPEWLNSNQPYYWIGVSPRTTDRKKARSAAIINAVLGYLRANKEGKCNIKHANSVDSSQESASTGTFSTTAYTRSKVTYNGFSCEIVDEYYNSRGEYFVRCGFVDNKQSKSKLELFQFIDYADKDNQEKVHCKAGILLLMNDQEYYSCDIDYDPSHDNGSFYQIKINNEPLIPATNLIYDKCQWNEHDEESLLQFHSDEIGQSLGVATLAVYSFLPFVPKSIKCTGRVIQTYYNINVNDYEAETNYRFSKSFNFTADTLCYPVPIHFLSLNGGNFSIQIGSVNCQEKELETWMEALGEPTGKRCLERQFPFISDYNGRAIDRISKTYSSMYDALANLSMKLDAKISINENNASHTTEMKTDIEYNDIGIRWYFENLPTPEQQEKIEKQFVKTKKHSRWPGLYIIAVPKNETAFLRGDSTPKASKSKQNVSKAALLEAKHMKKEGWQVVPDDPLLEIQLDNSYEFQNEWDENLTPKYLTAEGISVNANFDEAQWQATILAKQSLVNVFMNEINAFIENSVSNKQLTVDEASTITESIKKSKINIGHTIPIINIYRIMPNKYTEVVLRIACSFKRARQLAKNIVQIDLEKKDHKLYEKFAKLDW